MTKLVPPDSDGSTPLRVQIAELNDQLLVADEELRTQTGQAIGMLRERYGLSHEQAFVVLRATSQHVDVSVRDLAARLSDTGELPDLPSSRLS